MNGAHMATEVVREIRRRAEEVGVRVWLHAVDLDGARELAIDADDPGPTAAGFKGAVAGGLPRTGAGGGGCPPAPGAARANWPSPPPPRCRPRRCSRCRSRWNSPARARRARWTW